MTKPPIIDSHAHFFPKKYLKTLDELGIHFGQTLGTKFTTISSRLIDMDNANISMQAVSIAVPGVNMSTKENAVKLFHLDENNV